jgi:RHS repeat-associated protein
MIKLLPVRILLLLTAWLIATSGMLAQIPVPDPPTGLTTSVTETNVTLTWEPSTGASFYSVLIKRGATADFRLWGTTTNTTFALQGLLANEAYSACVTAENIFGRSPITNVITFLPYSLLQIESASNSVLTTNLIGNGVQISNLSYTGHERGVGIFRNGLAAGLDFETGIILATGDITNAIGPNTLDIADQKTSTAFGTPGDSSLSALLAGTGSTVHTNTHDAAVLEFDLVTTNTLVVFDFIFGSEEYPEFAFDKFNDIFAIFINGTNAATINGSSNRVSINSINHVHNSGLYIANSDGTNYPGIEFDGFTTRLVAMASVVPLATNRVKLAIADVYDQIYDSALFIRAGGFVAQAPQPPVFLSAQPLNQGALLEWSVPAGASGYLVKRATNSAGPFIEVARGAQNTFVDSMLVAGVEYFYTVTATNTLGTGLGSFQTNVTPGGLQFISQPIAMTVVLGEAVTFTAEASGTPTIGYQWFHNDTPISEGSSNQFSISATTMADNGYYHVIASNAFGQVVSTPVRLTLLHPDRPVINSITPALATNEYGSVVQLQGSASGGQPLSYQWFFQGEAISGATFSFNTISAFGHGDVGKYFFVAYNQYGAATSSVARLYGPSLNVDLSTNSVTVDCWADVPVEVLIHGGRPPFSVYWSGAAMSSAGPLITTNNRPTLVISNVVYEAAGMFTVWVVDADGTVESTSLRIQVRDPRPRWPLRADGTEAWWYSWQQRGKVPYPLPREADVLEGESMGGIMVVSIAVPRLVGGLSFYSATTNTYEGLGEPEIGTSQHFWQYGYGGQHEWYGLDYASLTNGLFAVISANAGSPTNSYQASTNHSGIYTVHLGNDYGSISRSLVIRVKQRPTITAHPQSQVLKTGSAGALSVAVAGSGPFEYRWYKDGSFHSCGDSSFVPSTVSPGTNTYHVVVKSPWGVATSAGATVMVGNPPYYTNSVLLTNIYVGDALVLTVSGPNDWTYTWAGGQLMSGATNAAISSAVLADAGNYTVGITNFFGGVTGLVASVTVLTNEPAIVIPPEDLVLNAGDTNIFWVKATGRPNLRFQWQFEGVNISNATNNFLTVVMDDTGTNAGTYTVVVTNGYGSATASAVAYFKAGPFANGNFNYTWYPGQFTGHYKRWNNSLNSFGAMLYDEPHLVLSAAKIASWERAVTFADWGQPYHVWSYDTNAIVSDFAFIPYYNYPSIEQRFLTDANQLYSVEFDVLFPRYVTKRFLNPDYWLEGEWKWPTNIPVYQLSQWTNTAFVGSATCNIYDAYGSNLATVTIDRPSLCRFSFTSTTSISTIRFQISDWVSTNWAIVDNVKLIAGEFTNSPGLPYIVTQPASVLASLGGNATFSVTATNASLGYQWYFNGSAISGATNDSYTISTVGTNHAGSYKVSLANDNGVIYSSTATLTIAYPPSITQQPTNTAAYVDGSAAFGVTAGGTAPFTYQWFGGGSPIPGATGSTLSLSLVDTSDFVAYYVVVSNSFGSAQSDAASLTQLTNGSGGSGGSSVFRFVIHPTNQVGFVSSNLTLLGRIDYEHRDLCSYQWYFDGDVLTNATNAVLTLTNLASAMDGLYWLEAVYGGQSLTSQVAQIVVFASGTNLAPLVSGGGPFYLRLPNALEITASASDDGQPTNSSLSYQWTTISGPGGASFSPDNQLTTTASFTNTGRYVLGLVVSDTQLSSTGKVLVVVSPENFAPTGTLSGLANINLPHSLFITNTIADDGQPVGAAPQLSWSVTNGPAGGRVVFSQVSSNVTEVQFATPGDYALKLVASDTELTNSWSYNVTVRPTNQAPQVVLSAPATFHLPNPLSLNPTVSDDGEPYGSSLSHAWSKVSGPGTASFSSASEAATAVSFSVAGEYVLRLVVSDGELSTTNTITTRARPGVQLGQTSSALLGPPDGSVFTLPKSILLRAAAADPADDIMRVEFYAGTNLLGSTTNLPFVFPWKNAPAGEYDVTTVAINSSNQRATSAVTHVTFKWDPGFGHFETVVPDLQIPSPGIPLAINRVHDNRLNAVGDFGWNWTLDVHLMRVQLPPQGLANGWLLSPRNNNHWELQATEPHTVTVQMPGNQNYDFEFSPVFEKGAHFPASPITLNQAHPELVEEQLTGGFLSPPGFAGSLVGLDAGATFAVNDPAMAGGLVSLSSGTYQSRGPMPDSEFEFAMPDGRYFHFMPEGGVDYVRDRNQNRVDYLSNRVEHSSGKCLLFLRDVQGRFARVYDPNGLTYVAPPSGSTNPGTWTPSGPAAVKYAYDTNDNLVRVDRLVNRSNGLYTATHYEYSDTRFPHHITRVRGALTTNVLLQIAYNDDGRIAQQIDAAGKTNSYTYDVTNRIVTMVDRTGKTTTEYYNLSGRVTNVVVGSITVANYTHDAQGRVATQTDASGATSEIAYDEQDRPTSTTDANGSTTSTTFNGFNLPSSTTAPGGNSTTYSYDGAGNLTGMTDALGNTTSSTYDERGLKLTDVDALTNTTSYAYDTVGNLIWVTNALGHTTSYTYDANGNRLTETVYRTRAPGQSPQAVTTHYFYDAMNRQYAMQDALGGVTLTGFDLMGRTVMTVDKLSRTNRMAYDAMGRLVSTTYPDGTSDLTTYDPEGKRLSYQDRASRTTSYYYDSLGRLTNTVAPDSTSTITVYDAGGRVLGNFDARSNYTAYAYDAGGRRVAVTNALAQVTQFLYDAAGNQHATVDALGRTNLTVFDALNRPVQRIFPDNTTNITAYDAIGRRVAETNQAGNVTGFGYDALGRLTSVTNALGTSAETRTFYGYDEVGNQITQTDALGRTTAYEYDDLGRRTKRILPEGQVETAGYDAAGNRRFLTNFNGQAIEFYYDNMNRLWAKGPVPASSWAVTFAYIPGTSLRSNMVDASGTTIYSYDERYRLSQKQTPNGTLDYSYDANGNLTLLASPHQRLTNSFDALNRLISVSHTNLGVTAYSYTAVGSLETVTQTNGVAHAYRYDSLNRLTNLVAAKSTNLLFNIGYTLAANGFRMAAKEDFFVAAQQTNTFYTDWQYDPQWRLTNAHSILSIEDTNGLVALTNVYGYRFDQVGNRTNATYTDGSTNLSWNHAYSSNDWLTAHAYDSAGNTLSNLSSGPQYFYDWEHRLTNAVLGSATISILYDGDGNRVRKTVNGTTTRYLVDDRNLTGYAQVIEELAGTSGDTPVRVYAYGLDLLSQFQQVGSNWVTSFYGYDGQGSVRMLTDGSGSLTDHYTFDPYGNLAYYGGETPNLYLYTGEQIDPDLGMYYLRARYYQPAIGRFWTMDSYEGETEEPASLHKYLYCHANPLNGTDPSGQMNLSMNMASISIAVAGIGQQASKYISRVPSMAKEAFSNGGPAIGRFFNQFGDKVNGYAHKVIELVPGVEILESRLAGCTRIPDFHLRFSNLRMVLEAKYRLPPAGEALTRLGAQLQQFSQWSSQGTGREVVVWALKRPDNASRAEEVVLRAAGSPNGVRFLYGVEELFQHLMTCAGL